MGLLIAKFFVGSRYRMHSGLFAVRE